MVPEMKKKTFIKSGEGVIASYDYVDVANGLGFVEFLGTTLGSNAATSYALITQELYAEVIGKTFNAGTQTFAFDSSEFNLPRTIKGTAYFQAGMYNVTSGSVTASTVQLIKSSGGANTNISAAITFNVPNGAAQDKTVLTPIPLTTTRINKGDFLRLVVIITKNAGDFSIGHDPKDRAFASIAATRILKVLIPFTVDV